MTFNENEFYAVVLGALLHDIGKFYQRTGAKLEAEDDYWIQNCCKRFHTPYGEKYSHKHAVYTGKFIRHHLKGYDLVEVLSMHHHVPENAPDSSKRYLTKLITLADWLASGERRDRDVDEELGDPATEPLISIFSRITIKGNTVPPQYFPISVLNPALEGMFPTPKPESAVAKDPEDPRSYFSLWKKFVKEVEQIDKNDTLNQILFLLEKYTLCIPAATYREKPDLSLFHHLKSVAAISSCLYQLKLPEVKIDEVLASIKNSKIDSETMQEPKFLFVGGDISGIQDFIYSITSVKALKGLRGRSFYLQLLSESVGKRILRDFALPDTNFLYSGGGHFSLLLPFTEEAIDKIVETKEQVDEVLFEAHKGKLAVIIGWQEVRWKDFINFGDIWEQLGLSLGKRKRQKFSELFKKEEGSLKVFEPFGLGGKSNACEVCGEETEKQELCSLCESFGKLSSTLVTAKAIEMVPVEPKRIKGKVLSWWDILESIGYYYCFPESKEKGAMAINSTDFVGRYSGYKFIAHHTPVKDGAVMTLEDISDEVERGIKRWGVLRADVDNLGKIFKEALGVDRTISRVCMLSYMLSLFFSAGVDEIAKDYQNKAYVVYSGGDDLFILGAWSVLPEIAKKIYDEFRKFTCNNLTLSAGIYIAPSKKFPVYQAASSSGDALEKAKKSGRNKITFLDKTIPWDEFEEVSEMADKIRDLLEGYGKDSVPRSLLSTLYGGWQERELAERKEISMPRIWKLFYTFKKLMKGFKEKDQQVYELEELLKKSVTDFNLMPYLDVATRWADYLTRKEV